MSSAQFPLVYAGFMMVLAALFFLAALRAKPD